MVYDFCVVLNVKFSEPYSKTLTSCTSKTFIKVWFINTPFKTSNLGLENSARGSDLLFLVQILKNLKMMSEFGIIQMTIV